MLNREELIKSLANKMDLEDQHNTKYGYARYNAATGTLYCEGITFPHSSLEKIQEYYKEKMIKYRSEMINNKQYTEDYMRAAVAYNAILLLKDNLEKW